MGSAVSSVGSTGSASGSVSGRVLEKVDARDEEEVENLRNQQGEEEQGKTDSSSSEEKLSYPSPQAGYQFPSSASPKVNAFVTGDGAGGSPRTALM